MTTDVFTPEKRSAVMRRVRGRDTAPELKVRRALREAGIGYRLGGCGLPGRPDVVMKGRRIALFVHGCFWHGHDCARGARQPRANADYWIAKIGRNRTRDARTSTELTDAGWTVVTVWECEMKTPDFAGDLVQAIRKAPPQAVPPQAASTAAASASPDRTY